MMVIGVIGGLLLIFGYDMFMKDRERKYVIEANAQAEITINRLIGSGHLYKLSEEDSKKYRFAKNELFRYYTINSYGNKSVQGFTSIRKAAAHYSDEFKQIYKY